MGEEVNWVSKTQHDNRHSVTYFVMTAILALILVELIHFLVRLTPTERGLYYAVRFHRPLLPQVVGLGASAYLLFDCYRRVIISFRDTRIGRVTTVVLGFVILSSIYAFAFVRPYYWVFILGFNHLVASFKNLQLYHMMKRKLRRAKMEEAPSSTWCLSEMRRWIYSGWVYGGIAIFFGFVYAVLLGILEGTETYVWLVHITPELINWFALIVFSCFIVVNYYWAPWRRPEPFFHPKSMSRIRTNLEKIYRGLENSLREDKQPSKSDS